MSAKDDFFKKVKENRNSGEEHAERVRQDITLFRSRLSELAEQITQWLQGSGIEITRTETLLNDDSVKQFPGNGTDGTYKTPQVNLKNGEKVAELKAECLYGAGLGCVSLIITNPYRAPSKTTFKLYMNIKNQPEEGWMIKIEHMPIHHAKLLTEEIFFGAIEALA
ncbi:hypothetical protein [Kosakonia sp. MUSA4]|uniref:hypothetical protein n=1 Tax=Kosakonia sp. MUSA4 TaxID=2067958 RepID=UPI00159AE885|nr:hypothetical protein [Kosakonia sp. MUSA4]QJT82294.1 hypothetical protein C0557_20530 [Kosakonia sp. MUSA4]